MAAQDQRCPPGQYMDVAAATLDWGWEQFWSGSPGTGVWADDYPLHHAGRLPHATVQGSLWAGQCGQAAPRVIKSWYASWVRLRGQDLGQSHGHLQLPRCVIWRHPEELSEAQESQGRKEGNDALGAFSLILWWVLQRPCLLFLGTPDFPPPSPAMVPPSPCLPGTINSHNV